MLGLAFDVKKTKHFMSRSIFVLQCLQASTDQYSIHKDSVVEMASEKPKLSRAGTMQQTAEVSKMNDLRRSKINAPTPFILLDYLCLQNTIPRSHSVIAMRSYERFSKIIS